MPHEIHVVTQQDRMGEVQHEFFAPGNGTRFASVCESAGFSRDEILFNQRTLHVVGDCAGDDCSADADGVVRLLRQLAASDGTSLTVVIADDAGASGHVLHGALQIVGRVSDRLLLDVSPQPVRAGRGARSQPRHVHVPLLLWPANDPLPQSYAEAVRRRRVDRQRVEQPDVLRLDRRRRVVSVGETSFTLPAMQFFWLYYLACTPGELFPLAEITQTFGSARRPPAALTQKLSDGRTRTFPADLQRVFTQLFPMAADKFDAMYLRACGPQPGLPSTISKINAALRRALGPGATPYLIQGGRGAGGYRITLPASACFGGGRL